MDPDHAALPPSLPPSHSHLIPQLLLSFFSRAPARHEISLSLPEDFTKDFNFPATSPLLLSPLLVPLRARRSPFSR